MKILLDNCINWRLKRFLPNHEVFSAGEMGWDGLGNGTLLATAAREGFEVLLTVDRNLRYQQNPRHLPMSVIVVIAQSNEIHYIIPFIPQIEDELSNLAPCTVVEIHARLTD